MESEDRVEERRFLKNAQRTKREADTNEAIRKVCNNYIDIPQK